MAMSTLEEENRKISEKLAWPAKNVITLSILQISLKFFLCSLMDLFHPTLNNIAQDMLWREKRPHAG